MPFTQPTLDCFPADSDGTYHALYTPYTHTIDTLLALLLILLAGYCVLAAVPLTATGLPTNAVCIRSQTRISPYKLKCSLRSLKSSGDVILPLSEVPWKSLLSGLVMRHLDATQQSVSLRVCDVL